MPLLQLAAVSLAYGHVPLLDHADLVIEEGERVGMIGRNGAGKSSLLRLATGESSPDDGTVWRAPGLRVGSVAQEPSFAPDLAVEAAIAAPMRAAVAAEDAWQVGHRVAALLSRFGLDGAAPVASLSGGQKKRVALAAALAAEPQLLVLDEPTNHLDIAGIEDLEALLTGFAGSVLLVTHDRRFLDRVATRIVELDRGRLLSYPGNFAAYSERKAAQLEVEAVEARKADKLLAQEEAWIRRGVQARRNRDEGRVRRLEALRAARAARRERIGRVSLAVAEGERSGQLVAELEHVDKRYGDRTVVSDFSTRIMRGDRIGLIGPNGSGKTTLLRLILGEIEPDAGRVRRGTKLAVAYFDQFRAALDDAATLAETISPGSDFIEIGGQRKHVISYLGDFLFSPERSHSPVKSLSGGERNRLLLARLFARPANVLVLDEPTNDLDIETLELLEELLQDYDGTVLLVSHDRAFLDNVVTQTLAYEGEGRWKEYAGGYDDWLRARPRPAKEAPAPKPAAIEEPRAARRPAKLSYNESRELEALPAKLEALEAEQKALADRLADPASYQDRTVDVRQMNERHLQIEGELHQLLERWEALERKRA